jgi:hypothetical protein
VRPLSVRARTFALLPLAALGVHQLRYQLAFGHEADHELAAQGHAYLSSLTPIVVLLAALAGAELIFRVSRAWRHARPTDRATQFVALAVAAAAILVAIYTAQELAEGLLSTGHPGGLMGVFGEGGWWSVPIASVFGAVIALLVRGTDAAVAAIARARHRHRPRARPKAPARRPADAFVPALDPFASAAPGRAPPPLSIAQ